MTKDFKVLVVDDEAIVRESLREWLSDAGHQVFIAEDANRALEVMKQQNPGIIFTDLIMPGIDGIELLKRVKEICPATEVVIITAYGSIPTAIAATREGAYDYIEKPFPPEKVELLIERVADRQRLIEENTALRERLAGRYRNDNLITDSPAMQEVAALIRTAAASDDPVFITGESGTGKEFIARAIHARSERKDKPCIAVSCAAFPAGLLEIELFGREAGNGAPPRRGKIEAAGGGTLFLDDVTALDPGLQVQLLRAFEESQFTRAGGSEPVPFDVRFISATDKDIKELISSGQFRQELYYRLNLIPISLPPLRERQADILPLAQYFLEKAAARNHKSVTGFSPEAVDLLTRYAWHGNIRELENTIGRAAILAKNSVIGINEIQSENMTATTSASSQALKDIERNHIRSVLARTGGNYSQAAKILGISRSTLHNKVASYKIRGGPD